MFHVNMTTPIAGTGHKGFQEFRRADESLILFIGIFWIVELAAVSFDCFQFSFISTPREGGFPIGSELAVEAMNSVDFRVVYHGSGPKGKADFEFARDSGHSVVLRPWP